MHKKRSIRTIYAFYYILRDKQVNAQNITILLQGFPANAEQLLPILHVIQQQHRHIPPTAIPQIALHIKRSSAEIQGVISYYDDFTLSPSNPKTIQLCAAEACQARGARTLLKDLPPHDGIAITQVYCLGNCACGPNARRRFNSCTLRQAKTPCVGPTSCCG